MLHTAPHFIPLCAVIAAIFIGPFVLDYGLNRLIHYRAVRRRLRDISR